MKIKRLFLVLSLSVLFVTPTVAAQLSSPNYQLDEAYFGLGGELDLSSPNYQSQQSAGGFEGEVTSGDTRSNAGFLTQNEPFLELTVTGSDVDLGVLSTIDTANGAAQGGACNCTFSVRTYISSAYVVKTVSNPPTNESGYSLIAKSTQGAPIIGTEEFGMNLVANTSPASVGADPTNQPDDTFADGEATSEYSVADQYKYAVGDTIARSPKTAGNEGVGQTDYTITYIANISALTNSGVYSMNQDLVVIATF